MCDVLTAHARQRQVWDPSSFGPLLYTPGPKLQRALVAFVCARVFVGPDCGGRSAGETQIGSFSHPTLMHIRQSRYSTGTFVSTVERCQEKRRVGGGDGRMVQ